MKYMELEDVPHTPNKMLNFGIVSIVIIVLVMSGVVLFARNRVQLARKAVMPDNSSTQAGAQITPRDSSLNGRMGLTQKGSAASFRKGDTVSFFIYADASKQEIDAYDAVIHYDVSKLKFESASSLLEDMDMYTSESEPTDAGGEVVLTGVRSLSRKTSFTLSNTALAEIHFSAVAPGQTKLEVFYEPGSRKDSNLMNTHNLDVLSSVGDATITIR